MRAKFLLVWLVVSFMSSAQAAPQLWQAFTKTAMKHAHLENLKFKTGTDLNITLEFGAKTGSLETGIIPANADTAIASWNALTPENTFLEIEIRALIGRHWTRYYKIARWNNTGEKHSFALESDADGRVNTDTLKLKKTAQAVQLKVNFHSSAAGVSPTLTGLALVSSLSSQHFTATKTKSNRQAWGLELAVPVHSQMIYPGGGEVWCSPTSVTMILGYWDAKLGTNLADIVPEAAKAMWDTVYDGSGNWAFNMAYASSKGLKAYVHRLSSLAQAESYILKGIPLALSIAWGVGELEGAHIAKSGGHLVVLRGFTKSGDVIINDPAAKTDAGVRTVYQRAELERAWIGHSGGVVYVIEGK
jgi:Peptidase_C39 like family